jgi:hypothetical protein
MEWFEKNKLIINKEKTVAISFHQPQSVHFECPLVKLYDTVINYSEYKNKTWSPTGFDLGPIVVPPLHK